ncbi:hypothetical protein Mapa_012390 [Marchantia paleacea]|nr:hypothetical protein Mapa_012390 [Marchantia paleacea]
MPKHLNRIVCTCAFHRIVLLRFAADIDELRVKVLRKKLRNQYPRPKAFPIPAPDPPLTAGPRVPNSITNGIPATSNATPVYSSSHKAPTAFVRKRHRGRWIQARGPVDPSPLPERLILELKCPRSSVK